MTTNPEPTEQRDETRHKWDSFVGLAQQYIDSGRLEVEELDYKYEIGKELCAARKAVLASDKDWPDLLKKALGSNDNLNNWRSQSAFLKWVESDTDAARRALRAMWVNGTASAAYRVSQFCSRFPASSLSGPGVRARVASVLMMGVDVQEYPPFMTTVFSRAYDITGYDKPGKGADEAALYEHALGFLDRFIHEAADRGLELRHRLDAQSVTWAIHYNRVAPIVPQPQTLAEELHYPSDFLETMRQLLEEKKQLIFQGPPGTGKTYAARKLAESLAESKECVRLVQFHPFLLLRGFRAGAPSRPYGRRPAYIQASGRPAERDRRARTG